MTFESLDDDETKLISLYRDLKIAREGIIKAIETMSKVNLFPSSPADAQPETGVAEPGKKE